MKTKWILFFLLLAGMVLAEGVTILREVVNPTSLTIGTKHLYIVEDTKISLYSLRDFILLNQFGKKGEGPGEFRDSPIVVPLKNQLVINSSGKISFYSIMGDFIRELKTPAGDCDKFLPLKGGFIGLERIADRNTFYLTANLYDPGLKKSKEIYRVKDYRQTAPFRIYFPFREPIYRLSNDKILLAGKPGFVVDIMDQWGTPLYSIQNKNFRRRKFTSADEEIFRRLLKKKFKERYELYKQYISFYDYYPEILDLFSDENNLYVLTWRIVDEKLEIFRYRFKSVTTKSNRNKNVVPSVFRAKIAWQNALKPYPMDIKNNKIYQLIENRKEEWELHVFDLNK